MSYKEYLEKIAKLTKEATMPGGGAGAYPASLVSSAQRALYNNLGKNENLALAVDVAIQAARQDGWKDSTIKAKKVRLAIREALAKAIEKPVNIDVAEQNVARDDYRIEVMTDKILELAKHQNAY